MKSKVAAALLISILAAAAHSCLAQHSPDPPATSIDKYLTVATSLGRFSGSVLVAKNGVILLRKGYGFANVERRIPFRAETPIEIASISKMFTDVALLKLRDDGKLRLDASLCDYLQDCPDTWKPITVEQVMHHASGIPDYEGPLDLGSPKYLAFMAAPDSTARILENAKHLPLDFKPGEKFKYSNTGYIVLGYLVQQVSGEPFGEFLTQRVLKPAGMVHSGVLGYGKQPKLATGYTHSDVAWPQMLKGVSLKDEGLSAVPVLPLAPPHGDAGVYSTLDDLYRWSRVMDGDSKLLSKGEIEEIFSPGRDSYGDGWIIGNEFGQKRYMHTGELPGYSSILIKYPDAGVTVIVLSNLDRARVNIVARTMSEIALGLPFDMPITGTVTTLAKDQQSALVGNYNMSDGTHLNVDPDGDGISAAIKGQFLAGLIPLSATEFYMPMSDGKVTFTIGPSGSATAVDLRYKGEDHRGQRDR